MLALNKTRIYQREMEPDKIRFQDEHATKQASDFELRCRKCRQPLATSQYILPHALNSSNEDQSIESSPVAAHRNCAHYFLDPLSWMRTELEQGKLEGRLNCPKCHTNVGKYAWQGMQCSCGEWRVPGISLLKGRIDETRKADHGIRRPPRIEGAPLSEPHATENL